MSDIKLTVIDREDKSHELDAPTDMNKNLMEICKAYELPVEGTCGGMALCASCHVYVESESIGLPSPHHRAIEWPSGQAGSGF